MNGEKLWKIFREKSDEESDGLPLSPIKGVSRRTFLEALGFSAAAIALSSCRVPEQKIVPSLRQSAEFTPGVANWYASTCGGCNASCGVLVKVRDGRPIKLEGNPDHPLTKGGLCAVAHGMVFSLYDSERLRQPLIGSRESSWGEVDEQIGDRLNEIKESGGGVRLLTGSITSPTSLAVIEKFLGRFKDGRHVTYQPVSSHSIRRAHMRTHDVAITPFYKFDKAKLVVSFGADFLGTWISPVQFTRAYSEARSLQDGGREMLRHLQFESRMSLTGSNADKRVKISPSEEVTALLLLAKLIAAKTSNNGAPAQLASLDSAKLSPQVQQSVERASNELLKLRGQSIVVSGSSDVDAQTVVNFINHWLGNYGSTLDLDASSAQSQGNDGEMAELVREMNEGKVAALIVSGVNPAYDFYAGRDFTGGLEKTPLKISLNPTMDETSALFDYVCPQHHFLEAWDDAEAVRGIYSLQQPTIAPLFKTRAYQESLMRWSGDTRSFYDALRECWKEKLFPRQKRYANFDDFWDSSLRDGVFTHEASSSNPPAFTTDGLSDALGRLTARETGGLSLILYEKVALRDGAHGNNPWLHELPDPITKVTWDNYASVSPALAEKLGLEGGRIVRLSKDSTAIELPVLIQPGQHDDCVAVALGYGRTKAGPAGNLVGANAYPFVSFDREAFQYSVPGIQLEKTPGRVELAKTQIKDSVEGRPLIREVTLADYIKGYEKEGGEEFGNVSLYDPHQYPEHKWGMAVDLSACVGCSACILSCQAENNVPVVGRDEVRNRREMHWIRIDRYYEETPEETKVSYQPVMCGQCDNASCESVCPVLATVHSSEGLNMQVYNRCVGTRYCSNNCAYKVRRFNWFAYSHDDALANLALNPDVTVRSRGVMEKCTFCVQRIEEAKIRARNEGRSIRDDEIQPACQQSCPAGAIVFGDMVELKSRVARLKQSGRNYVILEELNLHPAVTYLAKVRDSVEEV